MTYCTYAELALLTGSTLASGTLTAIIESGDRKIDAYLLPYGITASASGTFKEASLEMGKAGLIAEGLQSGKYQATSGDFTSSMDAVKAIDHHENMAYKLLDQYIDNQTTTITDKRCFIRAVQGR